MEAKTRDEVSMEKMGIKGTINPSLLDLDSLDLSSSDPNANLLDITNSDSTADFCRFLEGREIRID